MERVEIEAADYERMYEAAVEMARSLIRESNAKGEKILRLRAEVRELREKVGELRYNPYHDPTNGRFTSGNGVDISGGSGIIKLQMNLFDKNDPLYIDAVSIEEEYGFTDICLHGSPQSVQRTINGKLTNMTAEEFAVHLKENGYNGGNIRLASCSTGAGDNSFAQQLSGILGVKVKAPDTDVYYAPDEGVLFVGSPYSNIGNWRVFENGVEIK
nr:MAG TPA: Protein of unknown function (DUF4446) [Caudoviricetes sp.]